jgi:hypothetical protein
MCTRVIRTVTGVPSLFVPMSSFPFSASGLSNCEIW